MSIAATATYRDFETCIDAIIAAVGCDIVLGLPLGIGKPNGFVNALYRRAAADPAIRLRIFTALTPDLPAGRSLLERRFLEPIKERLYAGYEALEYARAVRTDSLPANIEVAEFYFAPGSWLGVPYAQRGHVSANYSHVTRLLIDRGINVVAQAVAARRAGDANGDGSGNSDGNSNGKGLRLSLGSNPDLTLDLVRELGPKRRPYLVGVITPAMPFMPNDAETGDEFWNAIVDTADARPAEPLFVVPNEPVSLADCAIATHVTSLIADGGTLQIGIGSLGDAIAHLIRLRQTDNASYRALCERLIGPQERAFRPGLTVELDAFSAGLYGSSEMLVEGFLHLIDAGVIRRRVAANADPAREVLLHAAFFIGSAGLYRRLHALGDAERDAIEMTGVRFVNTLDDDWALKNAQRVGARFVNSALMVTLDGAIVSDALEGKRVVSGVGGQHDFVGMAQHLPGARSIIVLPSTRTKDGKARSNIVFDYAHTTVPRQFRDIVVTEYGAADLRGKSDRDVMLRLLAISDARFQGELLERAQRSGKIEGEFRIPEAWPENTAKRLAERLSGQPAMSLPHFPLGTDFTDEEARLAVALDYLKSQAGSKRALARLLLGSGKSGEPVDALLSRLRLESASGLAERISRRLLLAALAATADGRPLTARPDRRKAVPQGPGL
jgi:acyl-CoA hydrolase